MTPVKAFFAAANVPRFAHRHFCMATFPFLARRSLLLAPVLALTLAAPLRAQDNTGPIPQGSSSYQKAQFGTILDLYESLTGKRLIRDSNLDGQGSVTVTTTGLNKTDTIKLIEATLLLNGVAIVPVDDQTMKVVTVGTNKNPRSEGLKLYTNAVDLPINDEVVTYYMPLNYINPQEAAGVFTQVAPPAHLRRLCAGAGGERGHHHGKFERRSASSLR